MTGLPTWREEPIARGHDRSPGGHLPVGAVERCMRAAASVGGTALFIDARDADAARWYARYGAVPLDDRPLSLIIPYVEFNRVRIAAGLPPI
ncbi:hypothetical protein [Tistrella mobilis]|uniref:GNAT family N-acetyltransferase n=1 Tax=Tistrella mobilis (strain KA081020-065) TaxID=1110502 RepID=I3TRS5_TISMK|nr:hypothetical protein [Tistrella mobilis]AFK55463.1 hypothetical protein TMO_a0060 [Tistrella mobilis KA081020-065]